MPLDPNSRWMERRADQSPDGDPPKNNSTATAASVAGAAVAAAGLIAAAPAVLIAGGLLVLGSLFARKR